MTEAPSSAADIEARAAEARSRARSWFRGGSGTPERKAFERALEGLRNVTASGPDEARRRLDAARLLAELGRVDEAIAETRLATDAAPGDPSTWTGLMDLQTKTARWPDVERTAYRLLALDPANPRASAALCWALRRMGRIGEAIAAGRRAVELDPGDPLTYGYLTYALLAADECAAALEVCDAGLARFPRDISCLAYRQAALEGLGRRDEAAALHDLARFVRTAEFDAGGNPRALTEINTRIASAAHIAPGRPNDETQTVDLLAEPTGVMAVLRGMLEESLRGYLAALPEDPAHPFLRYRPKAWELEGWATRMYEQGPLEHHIHQHGWVSGVYYVTVPPSVGAPDDRTAGFLECCRFPQFSKRPVTSEFMLVPPKPGLLVLFPSYVYHRVSPFRGNERRVSVAFNLIPLD